MPRLKKKYLNPQPEPKPATVMPSPVPYSFDLEQAAAYTGFSMWALRQAILDGELLVVNPKPYLIRRVDLEKYVDQRLQKVERVRKAA
jgi:hypothetical protein